MLLSDAIVVRISSPSCVRGVEDVCIVACGGLKGRPDAIGEIWPLATVQLCVVHLVRASLRPTVDAEQRFADFERTTGS